MTKKIKPAFEFLGIFLGEVVGETIIEVFSTKMGIIRPLILPSSIEGGYIESSTPKIEDKVVVETVGITAAVGS